MSRSIEFGTEVADFELALVDGNRRQITPEEQQAKRHQQQAIGNVRTPLSLHRGGLYHIPLFHRNRAQVDGVRSLDRHAPWRSRLGWIIQHGNDPVVS